MSETIKNVLLNYAVCSLAGGILEYIAPEKMRKILRVIITLFLVSTVVFPIIKSDVDLDAVFSTEENIENSEYSALVHTQSLLEKKLYGEIRNILINCEVNEYEIYITTAIDEDENTVYLEKIKIEVSSQFQNKAEDIKTLIPQEYKSVLEVGVKNE